MSKSLGNVISPSEVIKKYVADILRIWVANSNTNEDVKISFENLERQSENYRKIRNTIRFILGNMKNWDGKETRYEEFDCLDKFICNRLFKLNNEINDLYDNYNFNKLFQIILSFCSEELSTLFFDVRKDRLYCDEKNSIKVKTTKTILYYIFQYLVRWIAPIIPFTAEEAWQSWREEINSNIDESCHLLKKLEPSESWEKDDLDELWQKSLLLRIYFIMR